MLSLSLSVTLNAQVSSDTCADAANATPINGIGTFTVNAVDGSEIPNPICAANGTGASNGEWYAYTIDLTEETGVTISTDLSQNSGGDTRIHVYSGTCGSLVCVGGDDDDGTIGNGYLSIATFSAMPGTTYYIAFDDRWNDSGFDFEISYGDPIDVPDPEGPAPINFTESSLSTSGSNRAVVDMNGDFLDDIVSISSTNVNIQFQDPTQPNGFRLVNITTPSADYTPSWSLAAADYNADGYTDLLYGSGNGVTFMKAIVDNNNVNNGNAFDDVSGFEEASGSDYVFSQRSNFVDINNDGNLDAFVCHDVQPNVYYINDGTGNLVYYQTATAGAPYNLGDYASGGNYGSIWIDYDNDGDQDMFIAKCGGATARRTNQMHTNNNGVFVENAAALNLADPMQTWSSTWGDFDNDGDLDVFIGSSDPSDPHKLMRNDLDDSDPENITVTFTDVTAGSGVVGVTSFNHENVRYDFDNDGNLDIASNGDILFGNGDMTFSVNSDMVPSDGSFGDLNNDGFIDAFGGSIYMNNGNSNNWLTINTIGTTSNINGIGARVTIETPSGTQIREVRSGDGFRYMNTINTHFGIGTDASITSITVEWPSGIVDMISNPTINSTLQITEGENTLSLEEFTVNNLITYPNPTSEFLNLSTDLNLNKTPYMIFDVSGRLVKKGKINNNQLNVSTLAAGNYMLRISNQGAVKVQKFIKL